MKYKYLNLTVPFKKRKEYNRKIVHLVKSGDTQNLTEEDIFNSYSGKGGLHGLNFKDFLSYHQFGKSKREYEQGQFFTPPPICQDMVNLIKPTETDIIGDICCGSGNFFNFAPIESNCYGCEIDEKAVTVAKYLYPEANIIKEDIQYYDPQIKFDTILGNPPFNLSIGGFLSQYYYCIKSFDLLKPAGFLILVVPTSFLNDDYMTQKVRNEIDTRFNFICQYLLDRNTFPGVSLDTKVVVFQRKSNHIKRITPYKNEFVDHNMDFLQKTFIEPLLKEKKRLNAKLHLELRQELYEAEFYEIKKMLYQIKIGKNTKDKYPSCLRYFNKFKYQTKPENMESEEWEKHKITEKKVLKRLKAVLKSQHLKEKDEIRLVKTDYTFKLKAYSKEAKKKLVGTTEWTINDLVLGFTPIPDEMKAHPYKRLVMRKIREFERQSTPFHSMDTKQKGNKKINEFLDNYWFIGKDWFYQLNEFQKEDMKRFLWKRYSILNWQQGSGKTPAAYSWILWNRHRVKNVFLVGPANSIYMTWVPWLEKHKEDFIVIRKLDDIEKIKKGQIIAIPLSVLTQLEKSVKRYVKTLSYKFALVFDESDEATNYNSKRSRVVFNCFNRGKYKFLTTGTTTRNNVAELYQQLSILYNHSSNFVCTCEKTYHERKNSDGKKIEDRENKYFNKPFPPYFGNGLFRGCFNPSKTTVFGIEKQDQDIYNIDELKKLIEKTIISRKLEDIKGYKMYEIINHSIEQNSAERVVYKKILEELYSIIPKYFRQTGNSRKDNFLRIIQQLKMLIDAASMPQSFDEYTSKEQPNKAKKIFDIIENNNEKIAIGCLTKKAALYYFNKIKSLFESREVFYITGSTSFKKRKDILNEFEQTPNGVLISTQQSLKSSVNVPSCNLVIIESLPWNIPRLEQYFYRFIRFDSNSKTMVNIITYKYTIENNIFLLLMAKERINEFVKTLTLNDQTEQDYGIDESILGMLLQKSTDVDGNVRINWGDQKIA